MLLVSQRLLKMTEKMMIPLNEKFCINMIRLSDGRIGPADIGYLAEQQILSFFEHNFDDFGPNWFDERAIEFAEIYFPYVAEQWKKEDLDALTKDLNERQPLIWKEVAVVHGSKVRMQYRGTNHFAVVENGSILDDGQKYSPSEWASKVADGTVRNAWRDLWFQEPLAKVWVPAQLLRDQARTELSNV